MLLGLGLCSRGVPALRGPLLRSSMVLHPMGSVSLQRSRHSTKAPYTVISEDEARKPTLQVDAFQRSAAFKRPIAPHLTIYAPQVTSVLSIFHRITGAGIGVFMYGGAIAYALSPVTSVGLIEAALSLPTPLLLLGKAGVASAFVFHSLNGLRHLMWDSGVGLTLKGVYTSGYVVLGGTAIGTLLLLCL